LDAFGFVWTKLKATELNNQIIFLAAYFS